MKVLVLTQDFRGGGGAEKFIANLSLALRGQVDFTFVYPVVPNPGDRQFPYEGRLIPLEMQWVETRLRANQQAARIVRRLRALRTVIRQEQPDIVLSNFSYVWHYLAVTLRSTRLIEPKVVLRFGSSIRNEFEKRNSGYVRVFKSAVSHSDHVIANSRGIADDLARLVGVPSHKLTVINNSVAIAEIAKQAEVTEFTWPFSEEMPVILTAGRLAVEKNHALLIRAFRRVRDQRTARLAILGTGELEGELHRLVDVLGLHDDVAFLGWQSNPYPAMRCASVFALSSNYEGFPNALLEAMACGTPVVATNCPHGPSEILMHGRYGLLTPAGDEMAMAAAVIRLLDDADLRQQFAVRGKLRAEEYSVSRIAGQYVDLFHELAHA